MAYTLVNPGDPIHASQLNQIINSLVGTASAGQVLSFSALNDSAHYALTVQNQDSSNSNALNVLKNDGTVILQARGTGVTLSALNVSGLTAFSGGVQIGPSANALLRPMPNDSSSVLLQASGYVNVAGGPLISSNAYYDGTTWQRGSSASDTPTLFNQGNGAFGWFTVPAGTGAMPAWTQRMGLDSSGNLTTAGAITLTSGSLSVQSGVVDASSWVRAQGGSVYLGTGGQGLVTDGASLFLRATVGSANYSQHTDGSLAIFLAQQLDIGPAGAYIAPSGNDLVYRSTSGNHIFQTTGGSPGPINGGTGTFSGNITVQGSGSNVVPFTVGGVYEHIEHGQVTVNSVSNNTGANQLVGFARAFNSNPIVIISVGAVSSGDIQQWHAAAQNISTVAFNARVFNTSGATGNCQVYWYAIGN